MTTSQPSTLAERLRRALSGCPHCGHQFHGNFACDIGTVECGCVDDAAGPPDHDDALLVESAAAIATAMKVVAAARDALELVPHDSLSESHGDTSYCSNHKLAAALAAFDATVKP